MRHARAHAGFTLIEMMIAIALMAILIGIAVPSFRDSSLASQLRATSTDLIASANLARTEAIKRRAPVSVTSGDGGWDRGWTIIVPSTNEVIRRYEALPAGFRITATSAVTTVTFQPTGVGATPATFTICRASPDPGSQERVLTIDAAGRVASRRTTTGTCS